MKNLKYILILIILSYFFFMFGNGIISLTNPDEVFYAGTAKEMMQLHSWMTPYLFGQPQFEKPIFTYWLLRIAFIIFGITSFAARFFPALFAGIGVIALYLLGLAGFKDSKKAFLSSLILLSGGLYIGMARSLFTDMIFSVFILLSLVAFFWGYRLEKYKGAGLILFFIFSGLAVLVKGPLGLSIPLLTIILFLILRKELKFLLNKYSLLGFILFLLIALPWYMFMIKKYGHNFTHEFFYNDHIRRIFEAEHVKNDTWYFYPMSMIGCLFPWSLFLLGSVFTLPKILRKKDVFYLFLSCWVIAVFFTFQFAHSKLVSYILPFFPALALITGGFILGRLAENKRSRAIYTICLATVSLLLLIPVGLLASMSKYSHYLPSKAPVFILIGLFLILIALIFNFIRRGELLKSCYSFAALIPIIFAVIPMVKGNIEPYVSSKEISEYLLKNYSVNNTVFCTKAFVRGVRYYTAKEVGIIDAYNNNFFSPHPILFLNPDEKAIDYLVKYPVTYGVFKKSCLQTLQEQIIGKELKLTVLKLIGNEYLVKIETQQKLAK